MGLKETPREAGRKVKSAAYPGQDEAGLQYEREAQRADAGGCSRAQEDVNTAVADGAGGWQEIQEGVPEACDLEIAGGQNELKQ